VNVKRSVVQCWSVAVVCGALCACGPSPSDAGRERPPNQPPNQPPTDSRIGGGASVTDGPAGETRPGNSDTASAIATLRAERFPGRDVRAVAMIFVLPDCPIANSYAAEYTRLSRSYAARDVPLVIVHVDPDLSDERMRKHAEEFQIECQLGCGGPAQPGRLRPLFSVARGRCSIEAGSTTDMPEWENAAARRQRTTCATRSMRSSGDSRSRIQGRKPSVATFRSFPTTSKTMSKLRRAKPIMNSVIAAILLAWHGSVWSTRQQVLADDSKPSPHSETPLTFNRDIAPLIFEHCAACHRPGEVAPFSLLSYADVKKRAKLIESVTADRIMPPWKSREGQGPFVGERRLDKDRIERIARWIAQGMAEGDPRDLPPRPKFSDGWKLGTPDIVLTMPEAYEVPAEGNDIYRNFVFPVSIPAGRYLRGVEYRPGTRAVVHHAAFAADASGKSRKQDADDPAPGFKGSLVLPGRMLPGSLSAWVPGRDPLPLPDGFSLPWPEGTDLIVQLHLHPSGKPATEKSSVGLYLTDAPPRRTMVDLTLIDKKIDIPAGERNYRTRDEHTLPSAMDVFGIFPHMHMIGREIRITAHPPAGEEIPLLWIDSWDFNWQSYYQYVRPVRLPAGTRIVMDGVHDNSADNYRNPFHPPQRITWGEQTTDEMSLAMLQLVPADEASYALLSDAERKRLKAAITPARSTPGTALSAEELLKKHDLDGNGKLSVEELVKASGKGEHEMRDRMTRFDTDKDGALSIAELREAVKALGRSRDSSSR
jgi:hypothetical protein